MMSTNGPKTLIYRFLSWEHADHVGVAIVMGIVVLICLLIRCNQPQPVVVP